MLRDDTATAEYEPGQFFKRELPHLVRAVEAVRVDHAIDAIVVDAHVWLDEGRSGLGARLHDALDHRIAVIGVAKSAFHNGAGIPVTRGSSQSPLFVSAAGYDPQRAAELVRSMHGPFRLPTLLKRADQLSRTTRAR